METLSFPNLGLDFDIKRVAFSIFGFPVYWYGILIAAAFLIGAVYVLSRAKSFGVNSDRMMDVVLGGVLIGIVGARLYYIAFSWDTYKDDLIQIFNVRTGGLAVYGGVIGAVLAAVLMCRWRKVKALPALDLAAGGLLIGQAIGRWGNFVNIEAFGSNTTAPWGMTSPSIQYYLQINAASLEAIGVKVDPTMPVHPTFFYESMWCLLGFLFIAFYTKRRRFDGELSLIYIGWYGLGRFFIEGLRTDSLLIGSIRVSQLVAILCVLASLVLLVSIHSKIKRSNDPDYLVLFAETDEGKSMASGEYYENLKAAKETSQSEDDQNDDEAVSEDEESDSEDVTQEESAQSDNEDDKAEEVDASEEDSEDGK